MAFTVPCSKRWEVALGSAGPFLAALAPTPSARSSKVRPVLFSHAGVEGLTHLGVRIGSVGLVSRFGQFYKSVDPGLVQVNVCTESLRIVDVKIQISPIGRQKVITRDNVDVEM